MQPFEYPVNLQDTYDSLPTIYEDCVKLMDELMFVYCQLANHDEDRVEKLLIQSAHIKYRYIILAEDHSELSECFVLNYENNLPLMIWKHPFRNAYLRDCCEELEDFPFFSYEQGIDAVETPECSAVEEFIECELHQCDELDVVELPPQTATPHTQVSECGYPQVSVVCVEEHVVNTEDIDIWYDALDFTMEILSVESGLEELTIDHDMRNWIPDRRRFESLKVCCDHAASSDDTEWIGPYARMSSCYDNFVFVPGDFDPNCGSLISSMTGWCTIRSPDGIVVEVDGPVRRDRLKPLSYLALKADVRWLLTRT